ncbi:MAG: serine hydrolase [Oligoflexia bacterium]|nr:serine hydrolase [Oligoflexia bacterium]
MFAAIPSLVLLSFLLGCGKSTGRGSDTATGAGIEVSDFCEGIVSPQTDPPSFYEDNPTLPDTVPAGDARFDFTTATPADQGLDSAMLDDAVTVLDGKPYINSLLVMRGGDLVLEHYFHGSAADDSNNVHSASKSVLGLLVGIAIEQGDIDGIDQPVSELLPDLFDGKSETKRAITVGNLLTMSAGFAWIEDQSEGSIERTDDWLQTIVDLPLDSTPGTQFNYSTIQTHLMGAALAHATGQSLCDYAHDQIYTPLGIAAERWGRDPQGYFSGGFNVYLTARELLRFGKLVLDRGAADGQQLVPASWVDDATSRQITDAGNYYYGYYFWLRRGADTPLDIAWGYGGQLVYVIPDVDMVVVITTNTRDYGVEYDGADLVLERIVGAVL